MTLRQWVLTHGITRADCAAPSRVRVVRKRSVAGRVVFLMPAAHRAVTRPRAMLTLLEAAHPTAVAPVLQGEPIGTRFVRTVRRIYLNFPAIRAALKMELVD